MNEKQKAFLMMLPFTILLVALLLFTIKNEPLLLLIPGTIFFVIGCVWLFVKGLERWDK